jgi:hypothetical protein
MCYGCSPAPLTYDIDVLQVSVEDAAVLVGHALRLSGRDRAQAQQLAEAATWGSCCSLTPGTDTRCCHERYPNCCAACTLCLAPPYSSPHSCSAHNQRCECLQGQGGCRRQAACGQRRGCAGGQPGGAVAGAAGQLRPHLPGAHGGRGGRLPGCAADASFSRIWRWCGRHVAGANAPATLQAALIASHWSCLLCCRHG